MSDDWASVTKIGSKVRGPGTAQRETTVKGKSALNAAQRSGAIVGTEKKFASSNASGGPEGQRMTKIDRADGPVATKKVTAEVKKALEDARRAMKNNKGEDGITQKELAGKAAVPDKVVKDLELVGSDFPDMAMVQKIQKAANVRLTGKDIGAPMLGPKKK